MAAEGVEHLAGELGEHGGVVFAVEHKGVAAGAHAALDIGHGADGSPVLAELVHGDMALKTFPHVIGGHTLTDDVGVVGGNVEEAAGTDAVIVHEAARNVGVGAEIAALVAEHGLYDLQAPIQRVTGFDTIMPLFKLEHDYIPGVQRIIDAVEFTLAG